MWCRRCGSEYTGGVTRCSDCDLKLVEAEPDWADDPSALREIDDRYRALPARERLRRRYHLDLRHAWRMSHPLHATGRWPNNSIGAWIMRWARTGWYVVVGVPQNRVQKRKRLAKGPWLQPPT